jgi:hypothetical protein
LLRVIRRSRSPRVRAAVLLAYALVLALVGSAISVAPGTAGAAEPDQSGWWNRANTGASGPLGTVPPPPTPDVPDGGLPVSNVVSEPERVSALGLPVDPAPAGATVTSARLQVREVPDDGANRRADRAVVVACPITEFWTGGPNQPFDAVPPHDCDLGRVPGNRAENGTWRFDLTEVAAQWIDPASGLYANGVVLLPGAPEDDAPAGFQVVFSGAAGDTRFTMTTEGGDGGVDDPFGSDPMPDPSPVDPGPDTVGGGPTETPTQAPGDVGDASFDSGGLGDSGGTGGFGDSGGTGGSGGFAPDSFDVAAPSIGDGELDLPGLDAPATGDAAGGTGDATTAPIEPAAGGVSPDEVAAGPATIAQVGPASLLDIPGPVWLLLPLMLALLGVTSYSLGPAGEPVTDGRAGSITRALAARRSVISRSAQEDSR